MAKPVIRGEVIRVDNYDGTYWEVEFTVDTVVDGNTLKAGSTSRFYTSNPGVYGKNDETININGVNYETEVLFQFEGKVDFMDDGDMNVV